MVARVRRHRQGDVLASGGGGLVRRDRAVGHGSDGDAVAVNGSRGFARLENNIVDGGAGASLGRALKHKGEPGAGGAVTGRDGEAACAGDILGGVVLVNLAHVVLGVPDLRPGLALVQAGLDRQLQITGGELGIAGGEVEAQLHAALHGDLRQDQQLVLDGAAHVVRRADRRVAAPIPIVVDLPGLVIVTGTGALHGPACGEAAAVEVLVDAVGQGHGLFGEGRGDGVGLGDVFKGVGVHRALGCAVHNNGRDLVALGGGDGEGLAAVFLNGHRAAGGDAAALSGGSGDGKGLCGGRGSLAAANRGHLDIIDQNRAAAGVAVLGLIAERKLHAGRLELSRDLNRYIGRLIRRGYNGFRQLGNNACGVPDGVPGGAAVGAGFQCKGGTASAQRFLNLIDPVCAELERHVCGLAG